LEEETTQLSYMHTIKSKIDSEQNKYSREIQVEVRPLKHYILAEEYHQNYLDKNNKILS